MVIDKVAKYFQTDGMLELDCNLQGKVVTLNDEIMISIETPTNQQHRFNNTSSTGNKYNVLASVNQKAKRNMKRLLKKNAAIQLFANLNIKDILDDSISVDLAMKYVLNALNPSMDLEQTMQTSL